MYYKRLIDSHLIDWKNDPFRKPLILRGARQVGKSSAVRAFSKTFDDFLEINFEFSPQYKVLFEEELDPHRIMARIAVTAGKPIIPGKTLLFFDEIQACPKAISSLRFFYELAPEQHIIAAGSLLEFALQSLPSYGVGRLRSFYMYPFSFDEFLDAIGERLLLEEKRAASVSKPLYEPFHQKLNDYLQIFLIIGGMPDAVVRYIKTQQLLSTSEVLSDIIETLRADFAKYNSSVPVFRLSEVFNSVVSQAGNKFIYSKTSEQIKDYQAKKALEMLILAGWVLPITHSDSNGIPIGSGADYKKRKMLMLDTGIFQQILGLNLSNVFIDAQFAFVNKGVLAEHLWAHEYLKYHHPSHSPELYYWQREGKNNAEVDFVVQYRDMILPVEVKSSGKGSMQSLRVFLSEKNKPFGFRFSLESFSTFNDIHIFPLYAISNFVGFLRQ